MPPTRNIKSDLSVTVATNDYLPRRGERNVPKRYLKEAEWRTDHLEGDGYYANDSDGNAHPVDFIFSALQWGLTQWIPTETTYRVTRPAPIEYGLRIYDEERVERSQWGPIDGQPEEEESVVPTLRFGSDQAEDTGDDEVQIPATDAAERTEEQLSKLAENIPTNVTSIRTRTRADLPTLAYTMSQIQSTTTIPPATTLGRTARFAVP